MNWKMFKEMSLADKVKWIIHYYGIWICVGIIAICVIVTLVGKIIGPGEAYAARIMILDTNCSDEERIRMEEEMSEELGAPCEVIAYHQNDENQFQAFVVRLTGAELDVIIAPEEQMKELENNGYFKEMHLMEKDAHYYKITDAENDYLDNNLYFGSTENIKDETLEQVKNYLE